jgi:ABC-type multidrug transport system, ATPase component
VIETRGLTKFYGRAPGIIDLDLEVRSGEVFGFLGPNGAGKSTTIRTLLDLLHPTRGTATLFGLDSRAHSLSIRRRTGYLPADLAIYPAMTGRQALHYFCALRRFDKWQNVERLVERLGLDLDRRVGALSSGNRQKLGIVQAFMHEPELLILDEPTSGLDPLMQRQFFQLIDEVRAEGRTVFLSSHVLPEVERLADRVGIVRESRLVAVEDIEALRKRARPLLELVFGAPVAAESFAGLSGVRDATSTHDGRGIELKVDGSLAAVMRAAAALGVESITCREAHLEELFLRYYESDDA